MIYNDRHEDIGFWEWLRMLWVKPNMNPGVAAAQDLIEAQMDLLKAHKEWEYWTAKVDMLEGRVTRLERVT